MLKFSHPENGDFLSELLMAIDSEEQAGDDTSKELNSEAVAVSGDEVVNALESFPPVEEGLDGSAEAIHFGFLFGSEVEAVGSDPVHLLSYPIDH